MKPTMWTGLGMLAFVAAVAGLRPVGVPPDARRPGGRNRGTSGAAVSGGPNLAEDARPSGCSGS